MHIVIVVILLLLLLIIIESFTIAAMIAAGPMVFCMTVKGIGAGDSMPRLSCCPALSYLALAPAVNQQNVGFMPDKAAPSLHPH